MASLGRGLVDVALIEMNDLSLEYTPQVYHRYAILPLCCIGVVLKHVVRAICHGEGVLTCARLKGIDKAQVMPLLKH